MHPSLRRFAFLFLAATLAATPAIAQAPSDDPDLPGPAVGAFDKEWYLRARQAHLEQLLGTRDWVQGDNPRVAAIQQMQSGIAMMPPVSPNFWTPLGPAPIPNGQTTTISTAVSGRTISIVVHPTNPDLVYAGTAQGGLYRSTNGGTTWVPIFDNAASLAVGALALAPSNPEILYVGTGESSGSVDSFFGVGLYRIENASTTADLYGPFNPTPTTDVIGAKTFTGRSISEILVHPSDPATIFVSTASGVGGLGGQSYGSAPPTTALRGIYRSTDATSATPSFAKLTVTTSGSIAPDVTGNVIVSDMVFDPADPNVLVCWVRGGSTAGDGGIYRTANALAPSPTFTQTFVSSPNTIRGILTANRVLGVTTMIVGSGESAAGTGCTSGSGALRRSTDGGVTWSAKLLGGGGYCGGQCFYDLPVTIKPDDPTVILIGGAGNGTCSRMFARSVDAGASFSGAGVNDIGLHADCHAIAFAPSNTSIVYLGNDGGIFKSTNVGVTWTSMNTAGFSATQFQSIAVHPTDRWFTIGGTQDNGTNWFRPDETWNRCDWGDGGNALIDQNAPDATNVVMYHTYYNAQSSLVGYARVTNTAAAFDGNWDFLGNGANGIVISDRVQFYAPMARGPGNPNTVYYGTQRLYRSADMGNNHTTVSQNPISATAVLSAIGISPQDDNVRIIGTSQGAVWMTQTGSATLTDVTSPSFPVSATGGRYVTRTVIDPNNSNTAWVTFGGFGMPAGQHVWKTTNLAGGAGTWVAAGNGLPDVPVNAIAHDSANPGTLYVGTDIGVYKSTDDGANWLPYTTGMPVVTIFDMAIQQANRTLRVATHGRGIWERLLDADVSAVASLVNTEVREGRVLLAWRTDVSPGQAVTLERRAVPGEWEEVATLHVGTGGTLAYEDANVRASGVYDYRLALAVGTADAYGGLVRVDVAAANRLTMSGAFPNPTVAGMVIRFHLPNRAPATIDIVDAAGRRVLSREVGALGPGSHELDLRRERFAPGVYWAKLRQADRESSAKVVVLQ